MSDVERIEGAVVEGIGAAAKAIPIQKELFIRRGIISADVGRALHDGTLNIQLKTPLVVFQADHRLGRIEWQKDRLDAFRLTEISVCVADTGITTSALIYEASESPHVCNPWLVEVLAPTIDGVAPGRKIHVLLPRSIPLVRVDVGSLPDLAHMKVAMLTQSDETFKQ